MPLPGFQREVLQLLAAHRNPESQAGGGAVINRSSASPRYSYDRDLFHDTAAIVHASAEADVSVLAAHGFTTQWLIQQATMHRALVRRSGEQLRLDWCYDSAFRFFPVVPDPDFGYCLHPADLAVNKALALAGRSAIRDFVDILYLDEHYLDLGALCWAACGKDQGFTPNSMLEFARRNMKFREEDLAGEHLARPMSLADIKTRWLAAADRAAAWIAAMPPNEIGCLYLDSTMTPTAPEASTVTSAAPLRHFGSLAGAWPRPA